MGELASRGQLRMSQARIGLVIVPLILFLGEASGAGSGSGMTNGWFQRLTLPAAMPPGWAFPVAWTILYILIGLALTQVAAARGAVGRGVAVGFFVAQFVCNLAWSPVFFVAHQVWGALGLILLMIVLTIVTILAFRRVRPAAAWLMLPYLAWLCFAAFLNYQVAVLNPGAATLAPAGPSAQISL